MPSQMEKRKRLKMAKAEHPVEENKVLWRGQPDDIVVVVLGTTGVGKSTFVKHLISGRVEQAVKIGEELESCTVDPSANSNSKKQGSDSLEGCGSRLVIVDTPGFDDTYSDDSMILERIADWLTTSYGKDMKLAGVIYLHDISQPRVNHACRSNFEMVRALCGSSVTKATILGTTKWKGIPLSTAVKREKQLREKFWGKLMMYGAQTARFDNNSESAWDLVKDLLHPNIKAQILRLQEELAELEKTIPITAAGRKLRPMLQELLEMQKNSASHSRGGEYSARMAKKLQLIESLVGEIEALKPPMWQRVKSFFAGKSKQVWINRS